jgi:hypothetical protein
MVVAAAAPMTAKLAKTSWLMTDDRRVRCRNSIEIVTD